MRLTRDVERALKVCLDAVPGLRLPRSALNFLGNLLKFQCKGPHTQILARLLQGHRDDVILASKAGIPHPDAGDNSPLSAEGLLLSVEGSLRRLATDRLDLFYLHQPEREAPIPETFDAVGQLIRDGKIRAWGVSNYAAWQIGELSAAADAAVVPRPVVAQQLYNLLATRIEDEYLEFAQHTGLLSMIYNPLGGGLLTGKHSFAEPPTEGRFGNSRLARCTQAALLGPPAVPGGPQAG